MLARDYTADLRERLMDNPGVVLLGARQVGKSTIARQFAASTPDGVFLDLEHPEDRAKLTNPGLFFATNRNRLVILDEVQTWPDLFTVLRPEIDRDRHPGRFILLGSASGKLLRQSAESLTGRVSYLELPPLLYWETLDEAAKADSDKAFLDLLKLWQRGGMPLSYLARNDTASARWRDDYIQSVIRRDLPALGITIPGETLSRFLRLLAHQHGELFNASALALSMGGISPMTIARYLDIFCDAMIVRKLEPYHANLGKRLVKSPRVYFRDSGVLHSLLGISDANDLQSHPKAGHSWEGFVMHHLMSLVDRAPHINSLNFYRTTAGAEMDAVVETHQERIGFEIKLSQAPKVTKGFWQSMQDLKLSRAYIVAAVKSGWPIAENVWVIPMTDLPSVLAPP